MNDWRGTEIKVSSKVVYPLRQSSSLWMSEGEVLEIKPDGNLKIRVERDTTYFGCSKPGRITTLSVTSRVTVVQ